MAKEKVQLPDGVTQEMISEWKEKYGVIKRADLQDENGEFLRSVIMRVPNRKTMGEFEKWVDKQPNKAKEILINGCVLSDKEAVKADDVLFAAAFSAAVELIPVGKFTLADL